MAIRVLHYHPAVVLCWWMTAQVISTSVHVDPDLDLGLRLKRSLHPPSPGGFGSGHSHAPHHGIFTLLPYSTLYKSQHQNAFSNSTVVGTGAQARANSASRHGGHVLSMASVIGKDGSAMAKAFSVGGGRDKGQNSAVSIAQGKKVVSSAGSDAVRWDAAEAAIEESSGGGAKLREDVDKSFNSEETHEDDLKKNILSKPPPLSTLELQPHKHKPRH